MTRNSFSESGGVLALRRACRKEEVASSYEGTTCGQSQRAPRESFPAASSTSGGLQHQRLENRKINFPLEGLGEAARLSIFQEPLAQLKQKSSSMNNNNISSAGGSKTNTNNNSSIDNTSAQNQMNKVLAHSSSQLASADSYMAGMSSDSELSTGGRHHHSRPYSSQSRVYHAHPAPRNLHLSSSSRTSHYSDSAAPTFMASQQHQAKQAGSPGASGLLQHRVLASAALNHQQLTHQGSVSSSGSGSSASNIYQLQQEQAAALQRSVGRQLPQARAFQKQSVSIDQQALAHFGSHSNALGQHQLLAAGYGHLPAELLEQQQAIYQAQQAAYQQGPSPAALPEPARFLPVAGRQQLADAQAHELELLERQAGAMSLYEPEGLSQAVLPGRPPSGQQRQLFATLNMSPLEHGYSQLEQQYLPEQLRQQQLHQKSFREEVYGSQQASSSPAEWLPPVGPHKPAGQHVQQRQSAGRLKQTMSIDHYQASMSQPSYAAAGRSGSAGLSHQFTAGALDSAQAGHFRPSPVNFMAGSYESPGHSPHHQYHQHQHQQHQPQPQHQFGEQLGAGEHAGGQRQPGYAQRSSSSAGQQIHKLQQQVSSSSSSNSQSGSLRSSNLDISKTMVSLPGEQQKSSGAYAHQQQLRHHHHQHHHHQQHYQPRRAYTSGLSEGLSSSSNALNELEPASSHQQQSGHSSLTHRPQRSALRAASPSLGSEPLECGSAARGQHLHRQQHHAHHGQQYHHQQQQLMHSSPARDGSGSMLAGAEVRSESSTGLPNGSAGAGSSLTKKSNSATQLSMSGTKKRLGFRKKQVTSFSVHRSEEVAPMEARYLVKQGSSVSEGDSSMSGDSSSKSWSNSNFKQPTSEELASMSFIDGLGKGQMISRQGLASPYLGDIQLSLCDRRGNLEIEVIRARNLQAKTNKILPLTYVKLYLVKNRKCLAKAKTTLSNKRTLDPLFQQQLTFHEDYHGCILQSIIWGNFGKMDKKNFMGIAQISIDDLELSDTVISWYKLFLPSSLQTLPSKSLRHTLLSNSTESFTNTNNS